jgi:ADP-dependent NAD(P)H-hydrate dehydratase / NAD(P)H-hydrate epimerase
MKSLTSAEMRDVDRLTTERYGISSLQLMEAAGRSVFDYLLSRLGDTQTRQAAFLCGKGNNGGDGFVAARLLQERGLQPRVYLFARPDSVRGDAATNLARLKEAGAEVRVITGSVDWEAARAEVARSRVIVDALLGTGLKGRVEGLFAAVIEDVNRITHQASSVLPEMLLGVDTPSGLPSDGEPAHGPVICAHATLTYTAPKIGQLVSKDAGCCGKLLVREIGSPRELIEEIGKGRLRWLEPEEFRDLPLVRRADSHKGSYGHVLLIAGSRGKSGAAILAGRGALRAGAGLVTVAAPEESLPIIAAAQPELMTEPLVSTVQGTVALTNLDAGRFREVAKGKTLLAVGPGMGTLEETQRFVRSIVREAEQPVILDADGLNAFAGHTSELSQRKTPLLAVTPHPGEMARLCGSSNEEVQANRLGIALNAAAAWRTHVILKGYHTILATPDGRAFVNTTGNPGMAKGGSGDVLTGILAGMAAQFGAGNWERALALGVHLHGLAGDDTTVARQEAASLAGEIAECLPGAFRRLVTELQSRG